MQVMTINGSRYPLGADVNLRTLRSDLAGAAAGGGSFVEFVTRQRAVVSCLVTAHSAVELVEELEIEPEEGGGQYALAHESAWAYEL